MTKQFVSKELALESSVGAMPLPLNKQADLWNTFYADTEYEGAYVDGDRLMMPKIVGEKPSPRELYQAVISMKADGFCFNMPNTDKSYVKDATGRVCPVDFGFAMTSDSRYFKHMSGAIARLQGSRFRICTAASLGVVALPAVDAGEDERSLEFK